ncbi:MAG: haloalkane dehalogenase, partial [Pseudomonadota bacterium]
PEFHVGGIIKGGTTSVLDQSVIDAYNAPFPDETYKAGARQFPTLVPTEPDNVESESNRQAWNALGEIDLPFLTAFSDEDPVTEGLDVLFQQRIRGAAGQQHKQIRGGGHFIQEDKGEELAQIMIEFLAANQISNHLN